jgi:hypothetical protein
MVKEVFKKYHKVTKSMVCTKNNQIFSTNNGPQLQKIFIFSDNLITGIDISILVKK